MRKKHPWRHDSLTTGDEVHCLPVPAARQGKMINIKPRIDARKRTPNRTLMLIISGGEEPGTARCDQGSLEQTLPSQSSWLGEKRGPMCARYRDVVDDLRLAYDGSAAERDGREKAPWKVAERSRFLELLRGDRCERLLEIGAGAGQDSAFFSENGLAVIATDLSPQMVARCRAKGLDARVMDFLNLDFPAGSFDAVYALNCLLHVPNASLPEVLEIIRALLRPGGWFFLGLYGGDGEEGTATQDFHDPPRFSPGERTSKSSSSPAGLSSCSTSTSSSRPTSGFSR
jgi:hypothetical protein